MVTGGVLESSPREIPEAAIVILSPGPDGLPQDESPLARDTQRLLAALKEEGRFRSRIANISPQSLQQCLTGETEPSPERRACLRRLIPSSEAGIPVVAIVISYTLARGAWQRMECVGPRFSGLERNTYVVEADHPRPDIRARSRAEGLRCLTAALGSPSQSTSVPLPSVDNDAARRLADLNWQTCLQEQARRVALDAVEQRRGIPGADAVFGACRSQEEALERASAAMPVPVVGAPEAGSNRRQRVAGSIIQAIQETFRQHNYE
jgi:hypothetical protein